MARKEVRKSEVLVPGSNKEPSAAVVSTFLFVVCVALLYMFGWILQAKAQTPTSDLVCLPHRSYWL